MDLNKTSRFISLILRHRPDTIGISLDEHGWASVEELLAGISKTQYIDMETLEKIVETDSKQRYSFNEDKTLIRANQGHSIDVDVELPKSCLYVHLSGDESTATIVGSRHGRPVVYEVLASQMYHDGYEFFQSVNGVWLTKSVAVQYLKKLK